MPKRACSVSPCPNYAIPTGKGRCQRHARQRDKQINRKGKSIYNTKRWRILRRRKLSLNSRCEYVDPDEGPCPRMATDVHHRVDLADGGDPWKMENLESLCHPHHSMIGRAKQAAKGATA